jgi:DNA-binding CsgD family transcriptional regulator/energy-coupling factor transporter ATP-binding protein EcfA2
MSIPAADGHTRPEPQELFGRDAEVEQLTQVVRSAPEGDRVVILTGEAGSGKSALLDAAARLARDAGQRVLLGAGSEFESDLAFAGLHQLLHPVLSEAGQLLESQRAALLGAVGLRPIADVPKPMDVGIAVLTLLSDLTERGPLTVVIDDAHWMDRASLDVVAFVARRLAEEQISLLIGVRAGEVLPGFDWLGPRVVLGPLDEGAAIRLVSAQAPALTTRGRAQIIGQAAGNPLALRELARAAAADPAVLEVGSAAGALPVSDRLERIFTTQLGELPDETRQALLLLAAADAGDPAQDVFAALPGTGEQWLPAYQGGLVHRVGERIAFRHPLIRAAVYQRASFAERRSAHLRLAAALDGEPDRQAWHRAAAAFQPDAEVATALEQTADRALRRGGYAAAAAALESAAALSTNRADSARLLVAASGAAVYTGDLAWVEQLASRVRSLTDDPGLRRDVSLLAGHLTAFTANHDVAFPALTRIAEQAAGTDPATALDALSLAAVVGFYSGRESHRQVTASLQASVPAHTDDVLELWTAVVCDPFRGRANAAAALPALIGSARHRPDRLVMMAIVAELLDETALAVRTFDDAFALWHARGPLPNGLGCTAALAYLERGRWPQAHAVCAEVASLGQVTGLTHASACANAVEAMVFAQQGDVAQARNLADQALEAVDPDDSRSVAAYARRALATAAAVEGDYETAYQQYRSLFDADGAPVHYHACYPAVADLAAAGARTGHSPEAASIIEQASGRLGEDISPRLAALLRLARARLGDPGEAEPHFRAALTDAALAPFPFERACTLLDYAEWMRRQKRIAEARPLLATASEVFRRLGARPWVERAKGELRAAGIDVADAVPDAIAQLSPQQQEIIQLAARGLTNREIADRMFLSPRTVGSHLYRTFPRLGVTSRAQLRDLLASRAEGPGA